MGKEVKEEGKKREERGGEKKEGKKSSLPG